MSAQKFHTTDEQQAAILRLSEVDLVKLREAYAVISRETDWVLDASCPAFLAHVASYLWSAHGRSRVVHAAELALLGHSPHLATQVPRAALAAPTREQDSK